MRALNYLQGRHAFSRFPLTFKTIRGNRGARSKGPWLQWGAREWHTKGLLGAGTGYISFEMMRRPVSFGGAGAFEVAGSLRSPIPSLQEELGKLGLMLRSRHPGGRHVGCGKNKTPCDAWTYQTILPTLMDVHAGQEHSRWKARSRENTSFLGLGRESSWLWAARPGPGWLSGYSSHLGHGGGSGLRTAYRTG